MKKSNKTLIENWYHTMWNQWDKSIMPEILDENIVFRGSLGQDKKGISGLSEYIDFIRTAFPDFHNYIEMIITEDEKSFVKLRYTGTQKGEVFGIQPTDKQIEYYGTAIFSFKDGKIIDVWVLGDIYGLLNQLNG